MGKYAFLITGGPDRVGSVLNGIEYALTLDGSGHEVRVYLDGAATKWPGKLERRVDHPLYERFFELLDRELIVACAFCAEAFDATDGCRAAGISLRGTPDERHGPDVGRLVEDGFELLPIS
jgi:hypothetical protein